MNWESIWCCFDIASRVENAQRASRMQMPSHVPSVLTKPSTSERSDKLSKVNTTSNDFTDLRKSVEYLVEKVDKLEFEVRNTKRLLHERSRYTYEGYRPPRDHYGNNSRDYLYGRASQYDPYLKPDRYSHRSPSPTGYRSPSPYRMNSRSPESYRYRGYRSPSPFRLNPRSPESYRSQHRNSLNHPNDGALRSSHSFRNSPSPTRGRSPNRSVRGSPKRYLSPTRDDNRRVHFRDDSNQVN